MGSSNPTGVIPIYVNLVRKVDTARAHRIIMAASVAVVSLLVVAAVLGKQILSFFNVGLDDDFPIAGGLLALFIAFEMFQAHYGGFMQTIEEGVEGRRTSTVLPSRPWHFLSWWVLRK
jgi:multiple antibiotic resistance protein